MCCTPDLENSSNLHANNGLALELLHASINTTLILKESSNLVLTNFDSCVH